MTKPFLIPGLPANSLIKVGYGFGVDLTTASNTWVYTDVTGDVMDDPGIVISPFGRGDETSQAQPAACALTMLNESGAYSKGPMSPNYPNVKRNTPIQVWISLDNGVTWFIRFQGYITNWNPKWDISGNRPIVEITAGGTWVRIKKSKKKPLRSPLQRNVYTDTHTVEYWSMEDGANATQFGSDVGGTPALFTGMKPAQNFSDGSDARGVLHGLRLTGSDLLPTFDTTGTVSGFCSLSGQTGHAWQIDWHYLMPSNPAADTVVLQVNVSGGAIAYWQYIINSGGGFFRTVGYNAAGTVLVTSGVFFSDPNDPNVGQWGHFSIFSSDSGGTMTWGNNLSPSLGGGGLFDTGTIAGTAGVVTGWTVPNSPGIVGTQMGHVVVYNVANYIQPGDPAFGYVNEYADDRMQRLCDEEGIEFIKDGNSLEHMGAQGIDTFENLLRECEAVDSGLLIDGVGAGFFYICRSAFYDQAASLTCDVSLAQLADPFEPVDDDQRNNNLYVVTRKGGSSFTAVDENGPLGTKSIGLYDATPPGGDINVFSDNALPDIANWFVHLGTVDEPYRYPTFNLDIAAVPALAQAWLNTILTNRMDMTNVSSKALQHPPGTVRVLLEGYTETISQFVWEANCNVSPYRPWEVFAVADPRLGRLDTDGAKLVSSVTNNGTVLSVVSTASGPMNPTFDTSVSGFDIDLEGEQVTVTGIGNSGTDTFTRTVAAGGWGNMDSGQAWTPAGSATDFSVNGSLGLVTTSATGDRLITFPMGTATQDLLIQLPLQANPVGGVSRRGIALNYVDASNQYLAYAEVATTGAVTLVISKQVAGVKTVLSSVAVPTLLSADAFLRFRSCAGILQAKIWAVAGTQPQYWWCNAADTTFSGASAGCYANRQGTTPTVLNFDNLNVLNPQTFLATRSVNGVVKAHTTNAVVKLWKPGVLAR